MNVCVHSLRRSFSLLVMVALCSAVPGAAQTAASGEALDLFVHQRYAGARAALRARLDSVPDDLEALYLLGVVEQARILDYETYGFEGEAYLALADSIAGVLHRSRGRLGGSDSLDALFYEGATYGSKVIIASRRGDILSVLGDVYRSRRLLGGVVGRDSTYHAAWLGLGIYDYYLGRYLRWLPLYGDHVRQGMEKVRRATQARSPFDLGAKNTLCWMLIEQDRYREADSLCSLVLERYPHNSSFARIRASIDLWTHRYDAAQESARHLINLSRGAEGTNWATLVAGYGMLSDALERGGKVASRASVVERVCGLPIPPPHREIRSVREGVLRLGCGAAPAAQR